MDNLLAAAPAALACVLCRRPLDPAVAALHRALDRDLVARLRRRDPVWRRPDALCPDCVRSALAALEQGRSPTSLHNELGQSYPIYDRDDLTLLPTPLRTRANPNYTGRGVTIAFLDSGFYPHPDLTEPVNRVVAYVDATLPEPEVRPGFKRAEPTSWHGLMTASIAAGNGAASEGRFRGMAPDVQLVLVKTGNRRNRRIPDRDILRAFHWVLAHHAEYNIRAINISLGGDFPSNGDETPLDAAVEEAVANGIVVVAAAGNGGVNTIIPPASARSAISVGGLDDQNSLDPRYRRMWRSSYGRGVGGVLKPDLIAPSIWLAAAMLPRTWVHNEAMQLWRLAELPDRDLARFLRTPLAHQRFSQVTLRRPLDEIRGVIRRRLSEQKYIHPHYQHVDGTSMAAPIVTGLVAQMLEANPALTPPQIKDLLLNTAEPLAFVPRAEQGAGVVSAPLAVAAALRAPGAPLAGLPLSPRPTPAAVTFYCYAPGARSVALVSSFNGWQPLEGEMWASRAGVWQIMVPPPPPGTHAYKFLIDRRRWIHDTDNPAAQPDGAGGFYSLLVSPPLAG